MENAIISVQTSFAISLGTLVGLLAFIIKASSNYARLSLKVDTMWAFQIRRSMSEVVDSGIGSINSPLTFTDDARARLDPIKDGLIALCAKLPAKTSDAEIMLEIERQFGDDLLKRVCIPCQLSHGACLILALAIAKQTNMLELKL